MYGCIFDAVSDTVARANDGDGMYPPCSVYVKRVHERGVDCLCYAVSVRYFEKLNSNRTTGPTSNSSVPSLIRRAVCILVL